MNYYRVTAVFCEDCVDGKGGECDNPGCVLCRSARPDLPRVLRAIYYGADGTDVDVHSGGALVESCELHAEF